MKAGLWIGIGIGIALVLVTVGLIVGGAFLSRQVWANAPAITPQPGPSWSYPGMPGCGGMMYRWGAPAGSAAATPQPGGVQGYPGMPGCGWTGPRWSTGTPLTPTLTLDDARRAVEQYLADFGLSNLEIAELMEFEYNFYAIVRERDTGIGAMELLVDKWTGAVGPEMGPNMMWNSKYGMHARMMGGPVVTNTISEEEALRIAQRWLDAYRPGEIVEDADPFYGYYTIHTQRDGQIVGMLSVHGATGQVWYHTWHGRFIRMEEE
ncbi:MAG: hypothetical protein H5T61_10480 [Thermoflexales bacterium]|nr:hypothetical protein [Thermoflexales bacterium]